MVEPLVVSPSGVDAIALGDNAAFEHNGVLVQYEGIGAGEVGRSLAFVRDPRFVGTGFFAGEAPGGLTTVYGDPIPADVFVYWRDPDDPMAQEVLVGATKSAPDGTWRITGLNYNLQYVIRARASGRDDVTVVGAQPARGDVIAYVDHLEPTEDFDGLTGHVLLDSGLPPFTCEVIQPLPSGLTARVDGRKLLIEGRSYDGGHWESVVRVTASNGVWVDVPVQVRIVWTPAGLSVTPVVWVDHGSDVTDASGYVSALENRGSAGGVFLQPSAAYRPAILPAGLNGKRVLSFDGNDDRLYTQSQEAGAMLQNKSRASLFYVLRSKGITNRWQIVVYVPQTGGDKLGYLYGTPGNLNRAIGASTSAGVAVFSGSTTTNWEFGYAGLDLVAKTSSHYHDGYTGTQASGIATTSSSFGTEPSSSNAVQIGRNWWSGADGDVLHAELAALLVFDDVLLASDRQKLEGYYAHTFGLTDSLPADHPYKEVAP